MVEVEVEVVVQRWDELGQHLSLVNLGSSEAGPLLYAPACLVPRLFEAVNVPLEVKHRPDIYDGREVQRSELGRRSYQDSKEITWFDMELSFSVIGNPELGWSTCIATSIANGYGGAVSARLLLRICIPRDCHRIAPRTLCG